MVAVEERIEADLALGLHAAVVGELRELVREHPLQERLWAKLMLALYRSGRQADALHAYQEARRTLAGQLGIDPGPALRRLEEQILRQDAALEWRPHSGREETAAGRTATAAAIPAPGRTAAFKHERRWATVLVARIEDPERERSEAEPGRVGRRFLEQVAGEVQRHGGEVVASTGSSVTALFGAPVAHEDDAERAVRAGLAIRQLAASLRLPSAAIPVRVGIDTGDLQTAPGAAGNDRAGTVRGAAAEAADELARRARPGDVVVGGSTRQATSRAIRYEPMEPSGSPPGPVAWTAVDAGQLTGRPLSGTPVVGRRAELRLLQAVWERTVSERRSHLVTVLGPPGIGKSRLCHEFLATLEERSARVLHGRSLSYGDATYGAIAQMIRGAIGAGEDGSPGEVRRRLQPWLATFLPADEQGRAAQYLITLLSLVADFALPEQRRVIHVSVRRFFDAVAAEVEAGQPQPVRDRRRAPRLAGRMRPRRLLPASALVAAVLTSALAAPLLLQRPATVTQGPGAVTPPPGTKPGASPTAVKLLTNAALAAARAPMPAFGPGKYWYVLERGVKLGTNLDQAGSKQSFFYRFGYESETWWALDGSLSGHLRNGRAEFLNDTERAAWIAAGRPDLGLPNTEVYSPKVKMLIAGIGWLPSSHQDLVELISYLLEHYPLPPELRAALYQVLTRLDGVRLIGGVTDLAGRHAVSVAIDLDQPLHERDELLLDPATGRLLGARSVLTREVSGWRIPAGTVIDQSVFLEASVVDSRTTRVQSHPQVP